MQPNLQGEEKVKIAVSSTGNTLDSMVDSRFGRCPTFIIIDTDTMEFQAYSNDAVSSAHGAGIGAAQGIAKLGAKAILTGQVGPNAHMALRNAGVQMFVGASGTIREAVEAYKKGVLKSVSSPTVQGHFGQGGGRGRNR